MLKHIVFWKIKDNEDKEKNMEHMVKMLYSLDGRIKGLESIELGYNLDKSSEYDVVLCATLKSPGALKFYQNHPDHIKCKKFITTIVEKRISFDFVPEDPEFLDIEPDILDDEKPVEVSEPIEKPVESKPIESLNSVESNPVENNPQVGASDIQTSSVDSYQSLVRPVIPGINAPIDFVPPEEPETDYSIIPEVVKKSIKETQEDYDILESIVDDEQYDFEISSEPIEPVEPPKPIEPVKPVEPPKPIEPVKPVEPPKPIEPVKPVEAPKSIEPIEPPKPIEPVKPVESSKPTSMPFASKSESTEVHIPPIPVKPQKKSRLFGGKKTQDDTPQEIDMTNKWTCPSCGRINANYVGTCGCGAAKPLEDFDSEPKYTKPQEEEVPSNAWKCPKCGLIHSNFIMDCSCGYTKPDGFTVKPVNDEKDSRPNLNNPSELPPIAPMRASDVSSKPQKEIGTDIPKPVPMEVSSISKDKIQNLGFGERKSDVQKKPVRNPEPVQSRKPTPPPPPPIATKPEKKSFFGRKKKEEAKEEIDMSKFWKCPTCGKLNHNYVGTCGCGDTKPFEFNFGDDNMEEEVFVPKSNAWKCPECGKLNNNFVTKCNCGYENLNIEE